MAQVRTFVVFNGWVRIMVIKDERGGKGAISGSLREIAGNERSMEASEGVSRVRKGDNRGI